MRLPVTRFLSTGANRIERSERLRRSLLYVPGEERRLAALSKLSVKPDAIVFDLEDSVPPEKKQSARKLVLDALNNIDLGSIEKTVRINSVGSGWEADDLKVILQSPNVTTIHLPKTTTARDVQTIDHLIDLYVGSAEQKQRESEGRDLRIICLIESAMAMLKLTEICESSGRVDGLAFASVDYTADANLINQPDRREFLVPRQWMVMHASAYRLQAIDMVGDLRALLIFSPNPKFYRAKVCVDVKNDAYLEAEALEGRHWGYTGKAAIHPRQVDIINKAFAPSAKDVEQALRIVEGKALLHNPVALSFNVLEQGYKEFQKKGLGAFALDGKMIDEPVRKAAEKIIARAEAIKIQ
ncbi:hypothetical protein HDU93_005145 [Gonapodya sp. JEL0774]|nr:hypothetical protein HDU93_005145 [Gonapodya sp. JEL0774]